MSWDNKHPAHRTARIPKSTYQRTWYRDNGECQLRFPAVCIGRGQQLDHIHGIAELGYRDDSDSNLQWVCEPCHTLKTQQQRWPRRGRQPERHPGVRRRTP